MRNTVGKKIREIRKSKGITTNYLSEKVGVHPSTLSKWETGQRGIGADVLPIIAHALGVDVSIFFGDKVDETSNKTA